MGARMKLTIGLSALSIVIAGVAGASCVTDESIHPTEETEDTEDVIALVANFPPPGFTKVNVEPYPSHASYAGDFVNVWVNDDALPLYLEVPGPDGLVGETMSSWGPTPVEPAESYPPGTVLIRQDITTGGLAIMARLGDAPSSGELSWRWLKREPSGELHDGEGCWGCHGAFGSTDAAIGVPSYER